MVSTRQITPIGTIASSCHGRAGSWWVFAWWQKLQSRAMLLPFLCAVVQFLLHAAELNDACHEHVFAWRSRRSVMVYKATGRYHRELARLSQAQLQLAEGAHIEILERIKAAL